MDLRGWDGTRVEELGPAILFRVLGLLGFKHSVLGFRIVSLGF